MIQNINTHRLQRGLQIQLWLLKLQNTGAGFRILSLSVGKTIPEIIRRKNKFSSLNSCKIIFETVRCCPKFENIPEMEISITISKWMAQATN
ncbi:DUF4806 domain-containing protein, partial [Aphis craccivora]